MNLTDEQKTALNVGLNEWAGVVECDQWTTFTGFHMAKGECGHESCVPVGMLPRYCDDLNAINRLEERLTDEEHVRFQQCLYAVTIPEGAVSLERIKKHDRAQISASASQRAIALARALNLNIEGVTQ